MSSTRPAVVLAAHGSRDPRAAATVFALGRAVAAARGGIPVHSAFLELSTPSLASVLADLGDRPTIVVPLLLTPAYHARIDIPSVVAAAHDRGARVEVTGVLSAALESSERGELEPRGIEPGGVDRLETSDLGGLELGGIARLAAGLARRIRETGEPIDGFVLAAAGSRDERAIAVVDAVAASLSAAIGKPGRAGHVTGIGQPIDQAIQVLRREGTRRLALSSFFLAPGRLHDRAMSAAWPVRGCDAILPTAPLSSAPEIVEIITGHIDAALAPGELLTAAS